ncbi:MAG: hypothetical protein COB02_12965 [Candidatus Cloacimonadota bacterium]|nr:MAG: hypothetical protein COB02_12965 [Candidatus Cloacimonadota bacterium]
MALVKLFVITLLLQSVSFTSQLPIIPWKSSKIDVLKKFDIKITVTKASSKYDYKLHGYDFLLNLSLNNNFVIAYSLKYKGKNVNEVYKSIEKSFQSLYGPGELTLNKVLKKREWKQNSTTDVRLILIKEKLIVLINPIRKF